MEIPNNNSQTNYETLSAVVENKEDLDKLNKAFIKYSEQQFALKTIYATVECILFIVLLFFKPLFSLEYLRLFIICSVPWTVLTFILKSNINTDFYKEVQNIDYRNKNRILDQALVNIAKQR